jgi:hypothetical protein
LGLVLLVTQPKQANSIVVYDTLEGMDDSCYAPLSRNLAIDTEGGSLQVFRTGDESILNPAVAGGEDAGALVYSTLARRDFDVAGGDGARRRTMVPADPGEYPVLGAEVAAGDGRKGAVGDGLDDGRDVPGAADDPLLRTVRPYTLLLLATLRPLSSRVKTLFVFWTTGMMAACFCCAWGLLFGLASCEE